LPIGAGRVGGGGCGKARLGIRSPGGVQRLGFAVVGSQQAGAPGSEGGQVVARCEQRFAQGGQGLAGPVGGPGNARKPGQRGIQCQYLAVWSQHYKRRRQRRK